MKSVGIGRAVLFVFASVGLVALAQGCGASAGSYCNQVCDCQGCSATEMDECVDAVDDAKKVANEEGCSSEFSELFACLNSETTCDNDKAVAKGCDEQSVALAACSPKVTGFGKDPCQIYADKVIAKYEGCGVEVTVGGEPTECSGEVAAQAQCITPCIEMLGCECIDPGKVEAGECTAEASIPYINCVSACDQGS